MIDIKTWWKTYNDVIITTEHIPKIKKKEEDSYIDQMKYTVYLRDNVSQLLQFDIVYLFDLDEED